MTTFILTVFGVTCLALISSAPLYFALINAITGYEDRAGFHDGVVPANPTKGE